MVVKPHTKQNFLKCTIGLTLLTKTTLAPRTSRIHAGNTSRMPGGIAVAFGPGLNRFESTK